MSKISVIGAGSVGATIANDLMIQGVASEIVLIDINKKKAIGEALDIYQGAPFHSPAIVRSGDYENAAGSDIVVITCGIARKPGMSRLDLAQTNVNIIKQIAPRIVSCAPDAIYIIVSNPVDIITYVWNKLSGLPEKKIIGSGTILDTARLRARISEYYDINQQNVHAYVFGEHGDSSFVPWSLANISNVPIAEYPNVVKAENALFPPMNFKEVEEYMRKSGGRVIQRKGATFYAVSLSVCHICKCLINGMDTTMTVSTMMHGEYGIEDVCLSTLNIVGRDGINGRILLPLTDEETALLHKSADCLKEIISNIQI